MKKRIILPVCLFVFIFQIFAVSYSEKSWRILEQAQVCFDSKNYSDAFQYANQALSCRKEEAKIEYDVLDKGISPAQVRKAGKEFASVLQVLKEREQKEAVSLIEKYLKLYGEAFFNDDVHNMLEWLKNRGVYPEADYLIGKIYQLEGEYSVARTYFERAYSEKKYLDIADTQYEILYSMAFLAKNYENDDSLEKILLLILDSDEIFKNDLLKKSVLRTIKVNKTETVDRLFSLYRGKSKYSLNALAELADLYEKQENDEKSAGISAIAAIEAFTHIHDALCERNSQFKYTTLKNFFAECSDYDEILDWAGEHNIWNLFYKLAERTEKLGLTEFASSLYSAVTAVPDEYYRILAGKKLND